MLIHSRYTAAIFLCIALLVHGLFGRHTPAKRLISISLGASDPQVYIYGWLIPSNGISGLVGNVLVANSPQIILSGIYMTYNGLFTYFMLGQEWDRFGLSRCGLRVNGTPRGAQRSTTFLQLPLHCSVPLLILSGVLHWLCSQSLFLVSLRINVVWFDNDRNTDDVREFLTCGYSAQGIIGVIVLGVVMVLALLLAGRRKYHGVVPMTGSCSAAISAMCHPDEIAEAEDLASFPLKWGVTRYKDSAEDKAPVGHCTFSSGEVERPTEGRLYAG